MVKVRIMSVFSAENCNVEVYLDDGTGEPVGSALFTFNFRRVSTRNVSSQPERIPHAGYAFDEVAAAKQQARLSLAKIVEGINDDMFLSSALYYIRVIEHDDNYDNWVQYNCKKCRFGAWSIIEGDTGPVLAQASFAVEQIVSEDVP